MSSIQKETRDVSSFRSLVLKGKGDILLTQGENESLVLEADQEVLSHITSEVKEGVLTISYKSWFDFLLPSSSLKVYVTMREVRGIRISGTGKLEAGKISTNQLKLETSGSANMKITDLVAEDLLVVLSGTGDFDLAGKVTAQEVQVGGSGKYEARNLESQVASVQVSGSCKVAVHASTSLDLRVSGTAIVNYLGNPRVKQRVTGSANIQHIEQ
jgi:hypothetical protein